MNKAFIVVIVILIVVVLLGIVFFAFVPYGRTVLNEYKYTLHKVDDATLYQTRKKVEDSCRAMISSYTSDKLTYEQYATSDDPEKRGWAEQAKMRANKTASSYNEYVLKNSYVWEGNVPPDIRSELAYIQ